MPVLSVILRLLARLALLGALGAMRRRTAGAPPPWRTPGTGRPAPPPAATSAGPERTARLLRASLEAARIAVRVVLVAGFLGAFAVLLTAGTTAAALGPRWLGIVLLVLAAVALALALVELRAAWRLRLIQVRRRRAERLRAGEL